MKIVCHAINVCLFALCIWLVLPSDARLHGGVASGGVTPGLITTMTVQNTSGSTQATNFVTQIFGHPFKKGDIANGCTGGAPQFQLTNGTNVPFSEGKAPICWSDGSLKWAPFMLRVPTTVAGNGSLTINILSGGSTPSASSRALSDFATAGTDLNVSVTGLSNLSGVWTSNLNQGVGVANTDNYQYMDGDAGSVWRVRASFRQSGADHGQLEGYWYVQALNNASGTLGGLRATMKIAQPWYNIDSPTKDYRVFSAFTVNNGASLIRDMMGTKFNAGKNFTYPGSGTEVTSTANGFEDSFAIRVSNSGGALPTGLSTGTDYFVRTTSANTYQITDGVWGGPVTISGSCTGTCTATANPFVVHFGSLFASNTTASSDYIQAGGSVAADSTVRITFNNIYWRSTRMVPPYAIGLVSPSNMTATTYYPSAAGPVTRFPDGTGEGSHIGPEPDWAVIHFLNQDAADEQNVRVAALVGASGPIALRNKTTFTIPNVSNSNSYTGMPTKDTGLIWDAAPGTARGFTQPAHSNVYLGSLSAIDFSHMPELSYYALLAFGEPQFNDLMVDWADSAIVDHLGFLNPGTSTVNSNTMAIGGIHSNGGASRNITVNGVTFYGVVVGTGDLLRQEAWTVRTMAQGAAIAGGYEPAGAVTRTYFNDLMDAQHTAEVRYIAMLPAFTQASGFFNETSNQVNGIADGWASGYLLMSTAYAAALRDNPADNIAFGDHLAKWWKFVDSNFGVWNIPFYEGTQRQLYSFAIAGNSDAAPYLTSATEFGVCGGAYFTTWSNGSAVFDLTNLAGSTVPYVPTDGDYVRWWGTKYGNAPAALSPFTTYYMVNAGVGGSLKFQLSSTLGGSPITMTDTTAGSEPCIAAVLHQTTGSLNGAPLGNGYMQNETGAMNWWQAVGGTVDATTISHMRSNLAALGGYIDSAPKYAFVQAY